MNLLPWATFAGRNFYYRATGDRALLDTGIRFVNEFLIPSYGPEASKKAADVRASGDGTGAGRALPNDRRQTTSSIWPGICCAVTRAFR